MVGRKKAGKRLRIQSVKDGKWLQLHPSELVKLAAQEGWVGPIGGFCEDRCFASVPTRTPTLGPQPSLIGRALEEESVVSGVRIVQEPDDDLWNLVHSRGLPTEEGPSTVYVQFDAEPGDEDPRGGRRAVRQMVPVDFLPGAFFCSVSVGRRAAWSNLSMLCAGAALALIGFDLSFHLSYSLQGTLLKDCEDILSGRCLELEPRPGGRQVASGLGVYLAILSGLGVAASMAARKKQFLDDIKEALKIVRHWSCVLKVEVGKEKKKISRIAAVAAVQAKQEGRPIPEVAKAATQAAKAWGGDADDIKLAAEKALKIAKGEITVDPNAEESSSSSSSSSSTAEEEEERSWELQAAQDTEIFVPPVPPMTGVDPLCPMAKWTMTHFVLSAALGHALAYLATSVDVLVVGAGQAGMSAAYALRKMGLSVQILEATDHVGGRTRNVDVRTGQSDVETDDVIETWVRPVESVRQLLCPEQRSLTWARTCFMALPTVPSVRGKAQAVPDMFSSCFSLLQAFWIGLAGTGMYSFFKASTASPGLCQGHQNSFQHNDLTKSVRAWAKQVCHDMLAGQKGLSQQVLIVIRPSYQKALWSCNSLSRSAWAAIDARSTALRQAIILAQISLATQRPGDQEINVSLGST
eukprot:g28681.t1